MNFDITQFLKKDYWKKHWNENVKFYSLLFVFVLVRSIFLDQYQIPSESMVPNLLVGDRIFVNKMAYDLKFPFTQHSLFQVSSPQRGDIIVFIHPKDPDILLVKRLIGLPGDKIQIQKGFITINDIPVDGTLEAAIVAQRTSQFTYQEKIGEHNFTVRREMLYDKPDLQEFYVPDNSYFFMGDNRDNSLDGRYWGFAHREHIKGKAFRVFFSLHITDGFPWIDFKRWGQALP